MIKRPFCIWETCFQSLHRPLDLQCHFCWPDQQPPRLGGSSRSRGKAALGLSSQDLLIETIPCPEGSFQLQPEAHTLRMYHTELSVSTGARKLLFQMLQYRKIASLHLLPKKWQLNLCHTEATLQSHSAWQWSTLHAHVFPLCKSSGEKIHRGYNKDNWPQGLPCQWN